MIMTEVTHELQTVKELAEAQNECFRVEIEVLKKRSQEMELKSAKQLQEMELKVSSLERELGLLRAKEQKLGQHLDENAPARGKNKAQPTRQRKSLENSAEPIAEEVRPIPSPENNDNTPAPHSSPATNTQKQSYVSIAASQPAQAPHHPWTQVV